MRDKVVVVVVVLVVEEVVIETGEILISKKCHIRKKYRYIYQSKKIKMYGCVIQDIRASILFNFKIETTITDN